jgi:hypothetical protein
MFSLPALARLIASTSLCSAARLARRSSAFDVPATTLPFPLLISPLECLCISALVRVLPSLIPIEGTTGVIASPGLCMSKLFLLVPRALRGGGSGGGCDCSDGGCDGSDGDCDGSDVRAGCNVAEEGMRLGGLGGLGVEASEEERDGGSCSLVAEVTPTKGCWSMFPIWRRVGGGGGALLVGEIDDEFEGICGLVVNEYRVEPLLSSGGFVLRRRARGGVGGRFTVSIVRNLTSSSCS